MHRTAEAIESIFGAAAVISQKRGDIVLTIKALKDFGADVDQGLARCLGNEALYLRLVNTALNDPSFAKLAEALEQKDYDTAFESAHALKGVLGNLALGSLYQVATELTDELRTREDKDYQPLIQRLLKDKELLDSLRTG